MEQEAPKRGRPKRGEEKGICTKPLPEQPALAVGIDIGVEGFHVREPTGWNYLQPIARVVSLNSPAHLWLIEHSRTASVRGICGMQHKTDIMDMRALCFAAVKLHISRKFAGCWEFDWAHNAMLLELRFMVNAHYKATADRTRFNNMTQRAIARQRAGGDLRLTAGHQRHPRGLGGLHRRCAAADTGRDHPCAVRR
jgi:hypothetical protein